MDRFTRGRADANNPRMTGLLSSVVAAKQTGGLQGEARGTAGGQA
jgi:hypothetical protein